MNRSLCEILLSDAHIELTHATSGELSNLICMGVKGVSSVCVTGAEVVLAVTTLLLRPDDIM